MIRRTFTVVIETDDDRQPSDKQVSDTISSNLEYDYHAIRSVDVRLTMATATRKRV